MSFTAFGSSQNTFSIRHQLTDDFKKAEYIRTGKTVYDPSITLKLETPELRELKTRFNATFISSTPQFVGTVTLKKASFGNKYSLSIDPIAFDHVLTEDELVAELNRMLAEAQPLLPQMAELNEQLNKEMEAKAAAEKAEREAKAAEAKAAREAKLVALRTINWDADTGKAIVNLHDAVAATAGNLSCEWVKEVTGINYKQQNGFMYDGSFINDRKVEVSANDNGSVYIVHYKDSKRSGSYHVVIMKNGVLQHITQTEDLTNWALDLRDTVANLLPKAVESKPRSVSATDTEWDALKRIAADKGTSVSALLLDLVKAAYPDFPRSDTKHGDASRFEKDAQ